MAQKKKATGKKRAPKEYDLRFHKMMGMADGGIVDCATSLGDHARYKISRENFLNLKNNHTPVKGCLLALSKLKFDEVGHPVAGHVAKSPRESFTFVASGIKSDVPKENVLSLSGEITGDHPRAGGAVLVLTDLEKQKEIRSIFNVNGKNKTSSWKFKAIEIEVLAAKEARAGVFTVANDKTLEQK